MTRDRRNRLLHLWLYEEEADDRAWRDGLDEEEEALVHFWDRMDKRIYKPEDETDFIRFWDDVLSYTPGAVS